MTTPPVGTPPVGAPPKDGFVISRNVIIVILLVIIAVGAVVAVFVLSGDDKAAAAEVQLEPISSSGENPFMPSVGTDEADVTPPPDSSGTFSADTPGLYGGSLNQSSCEPEVMITFLEANPDKAAAWAKVLGVSTSEIRRYVGELTPVILRADTAVTNHGFANGRATKIPAVLQAGTAVLVDKYGVPRVKCYCGNPLTPPRTYTTPTYVGTRWSGFRPADITIIQQTTVVINVFVLVDSKTGEPFDRPAGTTGSDDIPAEPPTPETTPTTSSTVPATTTPPATTPPTTTPAATGQDASDLMRRRLSQCAGVTFPFEEHVGGEQYSSRPDGAPGVYIVTVSGTTESGGQQVFEWRVDVAADRLTPVNGLAQTASQYCGALSG